MIKHVLANLKIEMCIVICIEDLPQITKEDIINLLLKDNEGDFMEYSTIKVNVELSVLVKDIESNPVTLSDIISIANEWGMKWIINAHSIIIDGKENQTEINSYGEHTIRIVSRFILMINLWIAKGSV